MNTKPALNGAQNKQRKREVVAKFDPSHFRTLFMQLDITSISNYDAVITSPATANKINYKKYPDALFELIFTGCLLKPGGTPIDNNSFLFSIFNAENTPQLKERVNVIKYSPSLFSF